MPTINIKFITALLILVIRGSTSFQGKMQPHAQKKVCYPRFTNLNEVSSPEGPYVDKDMVKVKTTADMLSSIWKSNVDYGKTNDISYRAVKEHFRYCQSVLKNEFSEPELSTSRTEDEATILDVSKKWVQAMIADFAVCPFTIDADLAGIPRGFVRYHVSHATTIDQAFAEYWNEVSILSSSTPRDIATTLLIFPYVEAFKGSFANFETYITCLDDALGEASNLNLENAINNVYFHADFKFRDRDGQVIMLFDDDGNPIGTSDTVVQPISYSRRSPWPIVNILRVPMVQASQKGVPQGKIFKQNELRLNAIGSVALERMFQSQDWSSLPPYAPYAIRKKEERERELEDKKQEELETVRLKKMEARRKIADKEDVIDDYGGLLSFEEQRQLIEEANKWMSNDPPDKT